MVLPFDATPRRPVAQRPPRRRPRRVSSERGAIEATHHGPNQLLHPASKSGALDLGELEAVLGALVPALSMPNRFRGLREPHGPEYGQRAVGNQQVSWAREDGRTFRRLIDMPALEVWIIEWGRATSLDLHDHGGSSGAVQVIRGELVETFTDLETRRPVGARRFRPNDRFSFGADHVHEIWNPTFEPALSLHAYSPRLTAMNFYGSGTSDFLRPIRTQSCS